MFSLRRRAACGIAAACLIVMTISTAQAAGALAVGVCGAYGYGFDFRKDADARAAALKKCTGGACKVVGDIHKSCAAMAIDARHPCGSFGWAIESHLGKAENISVKRCYEFGGHECVVRAWACDERG